MRKYQIGVIGSAADLKYGEGAREAAVRVGELIAERNGILVFGAEKDVDSLSTAASNGAKNKRGLTVGITYGKDKNIFNKEADVVIPTGLERGGGREFVLALACDALVIISGGSGTLNELTVAYQCNIPTVALTGYGGWADKLAGSFIDDRKRQLVINTSSPEEAVSQAFVEAKKYQKKYG